MTLIEVVTGLVILGTVLASLAIARGRFARQWADADRKLAATRALDAQIAEWMNLPTPAVPLRGEGALTGVPGCIWRTETRRDAEGTRLSAVIVRVDAIQRNNPQLLASVDLLVHVAPRPPASRPATPTGVRK